MTSRAPSQRQPLAAVFFVSGAAALIFEIVWFYRAGLVFGTTVVSASVVLAGFMGGLALGSFVVSRYAARIHRPILIYAVAEISVAIAGVGATALLPHLGSWTLATAFAVLLVPASAIGATLPLLVTALSRRSRTGGDRFGEALGWLYGWNTVGGVAGILSAELLLIERLGIMGTAWVAATLDLGVGVVALLWARRDDSEALAIEAVPNHRVVRSPGRLLACAFLSGAALLALEIVWFRFLAMFVLSTTLAMSVMVAVVLAAIGVGGIVAAMLLRTPHDSRARLAAVALACGTSVAGAYLAFQWLVDGAQIGDWRLVLWIAVALAAVPSLLSGVLFTLIGSVLRQTETSGTRAAARLALTNTLGAACGAPLAAFVLLPAIGMERSFFALAATYGAVALLGAGHIGLLRRPAVAAAAAGLAVLLAAFPFGLMREVYFTRTAQPYAADGSEIVAVREGPSETILLMQQRSFGVPVYSRLVTNGFSMSGTAIPAARYMKYFVYWPALMRAAPLRKILVICYGVGMTATAATEVTAAESIDIVDVSRDIVAMSDVIYSPDAHPLRDPRVRVHIEDGRYFLQSTGHRYDLITGEPPPPRTPGAVTIYTREYFQLVHDRLNDGGIATYWLPVARPHPGTDVDTIIRAFCDVFADCSLWNATPFDFMLVGSRGLDRAAPLVDAVPAAYREVGFELPEQIGATFLGDAAFLRELTKNTPPLTDDFPNRLRPVSWRRSLSDPRYGSDAAAAERYQNTLDPERARRAFSSSPFIRQLWPADLIARTQPFFVHQATINRVLWEGGRPLRQIEDLHELLTRTTLRTLPLWILGTDDVKQRAAERAGGSVAAYARGLTALAERRFEDAATELDAARGNRLAGERVLPLEAYALCLAGRQPEAHALAAGVSPGKAGDDSLHFWGWLGPTCGVGPFRR